MSVQVPYIVEMVEHERGWGSRHESYIAFLTEDLAKEYIKEEYAGTPEHAPDTYWAYNNLGYRTAGPLSYRLCATGAGNYIDKLEHLDL